MRRPPKGWTTSRITVRSKHEAEGRLVDCFVHTGAPGLAVNENVGLWVVSHTRSGMFINPGFWEADVACRFALALAANGDYTRSARDLLADEPMRGRVVQIRNRPEFSECSTFDTNPNPSDDALDA